MGGTWHWRKLAQLHKGHMDGWNMELEEASTVT